MLEQLIKEQIDPNAGAAQADSSRAILLGGNVLRARRAARGGTFQNVPACTAAAETHCVIAYSTFLQRTARRRVLRARRTARARSAPPPPGERSRLREPDAADAERLDGRSSCPIASTTPFPGALGCVQRAPAGVETGDPMGRGAWAVHGSVQERRRREWLQVTPGRQRSTSAEARPGNARSRMGSAPVSTSNIALGNLVNTVAIQATGVRV